jgi:hypothetical protein
LLGINAAHGQTRIIGAAPSHPVDPDDSPDAGLLTNADIISMTSLGLSDPVIVEKIRSTTAKRFDTSLEGLRALKVAHVSDAVIRIMINPNAAATAPAATNITRNDIPASAPVPREVGVYTLRDKNLVPVSPEVAVIKTGGFFISAVTYGAKHPHSVGEIRNPNSPLHLPPTQEFVIRLPDGARPDDLRIYKLDEKKETRELRFLDIGVWGKSHNDMDRLALPLPSPERLDPQTWKLSLHLGVGEYGLIAPPAHQVPNPSGELRAAFYVYTFSVR